MRRIGMRRMVARVAVATMALGVGVSGGAGADNPATGTIPGTGQALNISIDSPRQGSVHDFGDDLVVTGTTGVGTSSNTALALYLVDMSGSTQSSARSDCNGDGVRDYADNLNLDNSIGDVLDCEIAAVQALNAGLPELRPVEVGVIAWAADAVVADLDPRAGRQITTTPTADVNSNGIADVAEVVSSIRVGQVGRFTPMQASGNYTDYNKAAVKVLEYFGNHPADSKTIFFLTDGPSSAGVEPNVAAALVSQGFQVQAFGVNQPVCASSLIRFTIAVHGTCTPVEDPSALTAVLAGASPVGIDRVELRANGGPARAASFDALGGFEGTIPASDLIEGRNVIEATVVGADGEATSVTADVAVTVPCDQAGLGDIAGVDVPLVSGTVNDTVEPLLEGTGLEDLVDDLNCDVVDAIEDQVKAALAPLFGLFRF